jgi:hypothetical protein
VRREQVELVLFVLGGDASRGSGAGDGIRTRDILLGNKERPQRCALNLGDDRESP